MHLICDVYDRVKYGKKTLHLSAVRERLEACRLCLRFGHTHIACTTVSAPPPSKRDLSPNQDYNQWLTRNSILFAGEWEEHKDEGEDWPSGPLTPLPKVQILSEIPEIAFVTPPRKVLRAACTPEPWPIITRSQSTGKKRKTMKESILEELQNSGVVSSIECSFHLIDQQSPVTEYSKVKCSLCNRETSVNLLENHCYSKCHQDKSRKQARD